MRKEHSARRLSSCEKKNGLVQVKVKKKFWTIIEKLLDEKSFVKWSHVIKVWLFWLPVLLRESLFNFTLINWLGIMSKQQNEMWKCSVPFQNEITFLFCCLLTNTAQQMKSDKFAGSNTRINMPCFYHQKQIEMKRNTHKKTERLINK